MTDSSPHGTNPAATLLAFPASDVEPVETGAIAQILASPDTSDYVRRWLGAAVGRDPVLAYHEATALLGILELLACEDACAWLLPAMAAALQGDPRQAFLAAVDIAAALQPAAMALQEMGICLPEPANNRGASIDPL